MSGPEYDEEFEAYLRRRVRLDRRLPRSLSRLEPPADLDRIVLGMAREAIQPLPNAPLFRAPRWAVPLAMAASVLVSFSLMLEVGLRPATRALSSAPLVVELSNPAPAPAAPPRPESAPAPSALAAAAPRPSVSGVARQRTALSRVAPWHRATSSPPPALPAAPSNGSFSSAAVAGRAAPPAGIPSLPARSPSAAADGEPSHYGGGGYAPTPIRLASSAREMQTVVVVGTRIHFVPGVMSAIAVQTYSDYSGESRSLQAAAIPDLPSGLLEDSRAAHPAVRSLAGSASPEAAEERRAHPDPKEWLDHIREIRSEGLEDAADQELKLFRDAYPAYPVP